MLSLTARDGRFAGETGCCRHGMLTVGATLRTADGGAEGIVLKPGMVLRSVTIPNAAA
jgi:hypothetical protein